MDDDEKRRLERDADVAINRPIDDRALNDLELLLAEACQYQEAWYQLSLGNVIWFLHNDDELIDKVIRTAGQSLLLQTAIRKQKIARMNSESDTFERKARYAELVLTLLGQPDDLQDSGCIDRMMLLAVEFGLGSVDESTGTFAPAIDGV